MRIALIGGDFPAGEAQPVAGLQSFGDDDPAGEYRKAGFLIVVDSQRQIKPQLFCGAAGKLFEHRDVVGNCGEIDDALNSRVVHRRGAQRGVRRIHNDNGAIDPAFSGLTWALM